MVEAPRLAPRQSRGSLGARRNKWLVNLQQKVEAYIREHASHVAVRQAITHDSIFRKHADLIATKPSDYFDAKGQPIEPGKLSQEAWSI